MPRRTIDIALDAAELARQQGRHVEMFLASHSNRWHCRLWERAPTSDGEALPAHIQAGNVGIKGKGKILIAGTPRAVEKYLQAGKRHEVNAPAPRPRRARPISTPSVGELVSDLFGGKK